MSEFSSEWLALREDADHAARHPFAQELARWKSRADQRHIVDFGCGTGSNLRYLAPRIGGVQRWTCIDRNAALLDALAEESRRSDPTCAITTGNKDTLTLKTATFEATVELIEANLATDLTEIEFRERSLISAAALLDLVSQDWIDTLVSQCRSSRSSALFALSYDGRLSLQPPDRDDGLIRRLVNEHQLTDKGFGAALGPDSSLATATALRDAGFRVRSFDSSWRLSLQESRLQMALVEGWAEAAKALPGVDATIVNQWHQRRAAHLNAGRSRFVVGHEDLFAFSMD